MDEGSLGLRWDVVEGEERNTDWEVLPALPDFQIPVASTSISSGLLGEPKILQYQYMHLETAHSLAINGDKISESSR